MANTTVGNIYPVQATKDITEVNGMIILPVSRNDGKKGKSGISVKLPIVSESVLSLVFSHPIGKAFIVDCIDGVRSKIASSLHSVQKPITDTAIGIDAILAAMKVETENQRMTKDAIGTWFDSDLLMILDAAIRSKLPSISTDKMGKLLSGYKDDFQLLAGRNVIITAEQKIKLTKAIALLPDDYESIIGGKVIAALNDANNDIGDAL